MTSFRLAILLAGAVCLSALAAIPAATGMIMEQFLRQRVDGPSKAIEILNWDRGLFSSRIEWKLTTEGLMPLLGVREILFLDRAEHGFFHVKSRTSLDKNPWFKDLLDPQPGRKIPLDVVTEYRVFGSVESRITLADLSWEREGRSMKVRPGTARIFMDRQGRISGDLNWEGGRSPGRGAAGPLTLNWEVRQISGQGWDSRIVLALDHLRVEPGNKGSGPMELDHLAWELTSRPDPEKNCLSFLLDTDFQRLEWGTGLVREGAARIRLNRVDVDGWQWVMGAYSNLFAGLFKDLVWSDPDRQARDQRLKKAAKEMGFRFLGQCERFLKKGLEIRVDDLRARFDQNGEPKELQGNLALALKKTMTLAGFVPVLLRPEAAFEIFDLKTAMNLPLDMADRNPALVTPFLRGMETGLFIREKGVLSHRAEIIDNRLLVNHKEVYFE